MEEERCHKSCKSNATPISWKSDTISYAFMMGMHFLGILRSFVNNASKVLVLSCIYELATYFPQNARSTLVDLMLQARPALVAGENGIQEGRVYFLKDGIVI